MAALVLRWREVPPVVWRWRGPAQMASPIYAPNPPGIAAIIGARGSAGTDGGVSITRVAAIALGGHRVVKATVDGEAGYPDLDEPADADLILGITTGAASEGANATIQRAGEMIEGSWSWDLGPVFVGANGVLTQTPPAGGFIRLIGVADAADRLLIDLRPPIFTPA